MTQTRIYPANGKWVLQWQTERMTAPAFWYYDTKAEAQHDAASMQMR